MVEEGSFGCGFQSLDQQRGVDESMSYLINYSFSAYLSATSREGCVTISVPRESVTALTSPYHDIAVDGTWCLSYAGNESFFI